METPTVEAPSLVSSLRAHRGEVTCADASGPRLVTGGGDRALRLWRWAGGGGGGGGGGWEEAGAAAGAHRYGVTAARWSGGGALVASGGVDGCVRLWEGRALRPRRLLAAPAAAAVRALCWAGAGAGGGRLLAGHDDGALCVWLAARGELAARLAAHEGALHAVAAPAGGALLLTACTCGVLKVFDLVEVCASGTEDGSGPSPLTWIDGAHDLGALCADASEEGAAAATGGQDGVVRVWRGSGRGLRADGALEGHAAAVTAVRWAGALLASGSLDRTARLWAPAARACLHVVHAHVRYLTCVALDYRLRYLITGSNDKTIRTWSLGALTLEDDLEDPCVALSHFGIGDLEGIGPVECDDFADFALDDESAAEDAEDAEGGGARLVWHAPHAHAGAINCIAAHDDLLATASSDGTVKVYRWSGGAAEELAALAAHRYPALAADFGAGGALLLTAGLDARACLWDVQSGVLLRELSVPSGGDGGGGGGGAAGGDAGGGGVRAARVSPLRPPRLLLATDDGLAPYWTLADARLDPHPSRVYTGPAEALTCCAWSRDGRLAATGSAGGELRVLAPPAARALLHEPAAHDLGVQSCDFAPGPASAALDLAPRDHVLATAGSDSLLKLWRLRCTDLDLDPDADDVEEGTAETDEECRASFSCSVVTVRAVEAHGGGVTCVRWGGAAGAGAGAGAVLASAGADWWARVWLVSGAELTLTPLCAVPAEGGGGALSVALVGARLVAVGSLAGELAVWRVPRVPAGRAGAGGGDGEDDAEGAVARFWSGAGVARWLREYVTRPPGAGVGRACEAALLERAAAAGLTGARLLDEDLDEILETLGCGCEAITALAVDGEREKCALELAATRDRLRDELAWLRADPPLSALSSLSHPFIGRQQLGAGTGAGAGAGDGHGLLCPLTHRVMREPASAADGFTYERANILEWLLAAGAEGATSPVSGRRLGNTRVVPNHAARAALRLRLHAAAAAAAPAPHQPHDPHDPLRTDTSDA